MKHMKRAFKNQAKLGFRSRSWHHTRFFLLLLLRRISNTATSVIQKEIAPGTQAHAFHGFALVSCGQDALCAQLNTFHIISGITGSLAELEHFLKRKQTSFFFLLSSFNIARSSQC